MVLSTIFVVDLGNGESNSVAICRAWYIFVQENHVIDALLKEEGGMQSPLECNRYSKSVTHCMSECVCVCTWVHLLCVCVYEEHIPIRIGILYLADNMLAI